MNIMVGTMHFHDQLELNSRSYALGMVDYKF